nr:pyridoxal phosphate-dependent aminotransferase [Bacteroidota bacterium]
MALAHRLSEISESQTIAMSKLSRELQQQGHDIVNLTLGEPDFVTPDHIRMAAKKAIDEGYTHYTPIAGYADLRKAIVEKFKRENNLDFTTEQIVVSTGAKQSIANVILCIINPGDEVIVPTPYWVSYSQIIILAGGIPVYVDAGIDTNFKITPAQLQAAITPRTKCFIFSSPCNPSGTVYSRDELQALAKVFTNHPEVYVISDEIYEHIRTQAEHYSIASFSEIKNQVIVVNGVSKAYAMTGWRIGYIGAPLEIAKACDKIQGQFTSGTSSISQKAAVAALNSTPQQMMPMLSAFAIRRKLMHENLSDIPNLKVNNPEGAFYFFPDVSYFFGKSADGKTISSAEDLTMYLLADAKVSVVTGEAFGNGNCIRLSFATSDHLIVEACERIKNSLAKLV